MKLFRCMLCVTRGLRVPFTLPVRTVPSFCMDVVQDSRRPCSSSSLPRLRDAFCLEPLQRFLRKLEEAEPRLGGDGGSRLRVPELLLLVRRLRAREQELRDLDGLIQTDESEDIRELAEDEKVSCQEEIIKLKEQILFMLIPPDEADYSDLIMEVTAGVGGQEAMLFTAEMFTMYQRYAAYRNLTFEILEYSPSELGGLRQAAASIRGYEAYKNLKYEGGVHRVQRVPKTEKQGRMHTSTMTVAILPQPSEIILKINPKDLRIETKRASGAGGQHVNTTDSAVRITHIPTGVVSECQQERSQLRNKEKALQLLRAKLYNIKLNEERSRRENTRKIQIGSKGRSEKIRTYNFPQDRITDHRIGRTLHDIDRFMFGEELLDEMIQCLKECADYESLIEALSENSV